MKFFEKRHCLNGLWIGLGMAGMLLSACKSPQKLGKSGMPVIELDTMEITISRDNSYRESAQRINDLLHVALAVEPNYSNATLSGKATLLFKPYFYSTDSLVLDAKHFNLNRVALISGTDTITLQYQYEDSLHCHIRLNRRYNASEQYRIYVEYVANPNSFHGGSEAITEDKGLYFINPLGADSTKPIQVWTQGETESASCWFPCIDHPNERTTQEIWITHHPKYQTLSNGVLISSKMLNDSVATDYWKMDLPHAPYLFMMVIGSFDVTKDRWRNIPVEYWINPKYQTSVGKIFGNTPEMMDFFSKKLGYNYPWPKYTSVVVYDYVSGAMENTSSSLFGEFMQRNSRELLDESHEDIVAHELFHQWFGDLVTCESWSNLPLNESFATYGEYLWNEYKHGKSYADMRLRDYFFKYLDEAENSPKSLIRYKYESREDMFDAHSYEKGGHVLHMLRSELGDEAFFTGLNKYLHKMQFASAEIHDLRLIFEEVCGRDLQPFFNQWFFAKGHPELDIRTKVTDNRVTLTVAQKQVPDEGLLYQLNTVFNVHTTDSLYRFPVRLNRADHTFEYTVKGTVLSTDLDPERILLTVRKEHKTPEEWKALFKYASSYIAKAEALENLYESKLRLNDNAAFILTALKDPFYGIRAVALAGMDEQPEDTAVANRVKYLIQQDVNSLVRMEAVSAIADWKIEGKKELLLRAMKDSSYQVNAAALLAMAKEDFTEASAYANRWKNESNFDLMEAVIKVISLRGNPEDTSWFYQRMQHPGSTSEAYILPGAMIRLLVHFPLNEARSVLDYLKVWFQSGKAPYAFTYSNLINRAWMAADQLTKSTYSVEQDPRIQDHAKQIKQWLESEKKRLKKQQG